MHRLGWHFTARDRKLANGDGRAIVSGKKLTVEGELGLCDYGLHDSVSVLDALRYAPGPYVWRTRPSGEILEGDDMRCAAERTALWGYDATPVLRHFARLCVLDVVRTGDEPIRWAAWSAAKDAATSAARDAAWSAAKDAAKDVAWHATWSAAKNAAWHAAWHAAWDAAKDAARDAQVRRLHRMLMAGRSL